MMYKKIIAYLLASVVLAGAVSSCNKSDDDDDDGSIDTGNISYSSVLISSVRMAANEQILTHLDSVKFTIDVDKGEIYNVDSLPKGTRVDHIGLNITFPSAVSLAQISIKNGTKQNDTTFNYTSSADSIDFTGNVTLTVRSYDGTLQRDYSIKVNVHQQEPDELYWGSMQYSALPGASGSSFNASKTVQQGSTYVCLVRNGSSYVFSRSQSPAGNWSSSEAQLPFTPDVASLAATADALYLLDDGGNLYQSRDYGASWTAAGVQWHTIIGGYGSTLLGITRSGNAYYHDAYPRTSGFEPYAIEDGFPIEGMSQLVMASNTWVINNQAMIACGKLKDGSATNAVWGYDGERWGQINDTSSTSALPKLSEVTLFPYYTFTTSSDGANATQHVAWFVVGGMTEADTLSRVVYVSRDQGIDWKEADDELQLPSYITAFRGAQAFVVSETLTDVANAPAWRTMPAKELPAWATPLSNSAAAQPTTALASRRKVSQPVHEWQCPFIYLFGGRIVNGYYVNTVWRGALNRLTYKPIY